MTAEEFYKEFQLRGPLRDFITTREDYHRKRVFEFAEAYHAARAQPPASSGWVDVRRDHCGHIFAVLRESGKIDYEIEITESQLAWFNALRSSPRSGWVDVRERLPKFDVEVLWVTESGNHFIESIDKDDYCLNEPQCWYSNCTHWMSLDWLPSPPTPTEGL